MVHLISRLGARPETGEVAGLKRNLIPRVSFPNQGKPGTFKKSVFRVRLLDFSGYTV